MGETLRSMLGETWTATVAGATRLLPRLAMAVLILLVGLLVGRLLRALTLRFFFALRLDRASDRLGLSALLARGDARYTVAEAVATLVYWLVLVLALQMLGWVLGLEAVTKFFGQVLDYLPHVLVAVVIALAGLAIGSLFGGAVQVAAANADVPVARPLGRIVKYMIAFFALALSFEELNIASHLLTTTFLVVVGAGCFGVALAFGLGCKDLARDMAVRWMSRRQEASDSEQQHKNVPHSRP